MPRQLSGPRKRRTREHIIADLSINHVEKQVLLAGHTVERKRHDYGTDLLLSTYDEQGAPETGFVVVQVKATDSLPTVRGERFVTCRIERAHLRAWLIDLFPVMLIVYDAASDRAYWLYVQAAFPGAKRFRAARGTKRLTLHLPVEQILDPKAVERFRGFLQDIREQHKGTSHHD